MTISRKYLKQVLKISCSLKLIIINVPIESWHFISIPINDFPDIVNICVRKCKNKRNFLNYCYCLSLK